MNGAGTASAATPQSTYRQIDQVRFDRLRRRRRYRSELQAQSEGEEYAAPNEKRYSDDRRQPMPRLVEVRKSYKALLCELAHRPHTPEDR